MRHRVASWTLFAVTVLGIIAVFVAHFVDLWVVEDFVQSLILPTIGAAILGLMLTLRLPENRIGWVLACVGLSGPLGSIAQSAQTPVTASDPEWLLPLLEAVEGVSFLLLFGGLLVFFPLWFPDGRLHSRRWRWVTPTYLLVSLLLLAALGAGMIADDGSTTFSILVPLTWVLVGPVAAFAAMVSRYRSSDIVVRAQLKWLVLAVGFILGGFISSFFVAYLPPWLNDALQLGVFVFFFVAIWWSITKHRLFEIDRLISRSVTYVLVIGLLATGLAGVAAFAGSQFQEPWVVAATTLGVAAAFNPVRRRVQSVVDRRFDRSRYDAERVMGVVAASLRNEVDSEIILAGWIAAVAETMHPSSARIWVRSSR